MEKTLERELILRRIRTERAKGTPFAEMLDIIEDMVESQLLASYLAKLPDTPQPATLVPPSLHDDTTPEQGGAGMVHDDSLGALKRHLISLRACKSVEPLSAERRRERVNAVLEILKTHSERPPKANDPNADDK